MNLYGGEGEPNGDSQRLINRYGVDRQIAVNSFMLTTYARINDWGPYDYHRDFNNTFPLQLMGDLSHTVGTPKWFGEAQSRLGIRALWRSLDTNSPRYCPVTLPNSLGAQVCNPNALGSNGSEWEIRTYLDFWM